MLKSKIHRATVTDTQLDYEGSLTIDLDLMTAADILPHEQIHVWDVTSGSRLITYAIPGERGSGIVRVNGAGAHLIKTGNTIIIATFTDLPTRRAKKYAPTVVFVTNDNRIRTAVEETKIPLAFKDEEPIPLPPPEEPTAKKSRKPKL
jgi:aspartate 1-decarboxylase